MLMMLPFEAPTIFEGIHKSCFRMPRVVKDQRAKFENDDLFRQLSHESAVKYTGFKDRPLEERQVKFFSNCQEGHTEVSVVQSGNQFTLMFNPTANPAYNNEGCDFDKELGKVHIKSSFILNGVCVLWRGWIDLQRLEGFGCLEFDEYRAYLEESLVKQQIDKQQACNTTANTTASHSPLLSRLSQQHAAFGPPVPPPMAMVPPTSSAHPLCLGPTAGPHLLGGGGGGPPPVSLADSAAQYGNAAIAAAAAAFHQALAVGGPPPPLPPLDNGLAPAGSLPPPPHHLPYTNESIIPSSVTNFGAVNARTSPLAQHAMHHILNGGSAASQQVTSTTSNTGNSNSNSNNNNSTSNQSTGNTTPRKNSPTHTAAGNRENSKSPADANQRPQVRPQQQQQAIKRQIPDEQTQIDDVDVVSDINTPDLDFPPRRIFKSDHMHHAHHHHHHHAHRAARRAA